MPRAQCKSMGSTEYELINRGEDWNGSRPVSAVNDPFCPTPVGTMEAGSTLEHHSCSLPSLDNDWFPILREKLKQDKAPAPAPDDADGPGGVAKSARLAQRSRPVAMDDIDGRGTFQAKELEAELREMHRSTLQDQLGISFNKISDIIRRSDVNHDGEIDYKTFLETVQQYRLSTEQSTTLTSIVRAFAYAEEFSCRPPTLFMILITLVELGIFIFHCVHLSTVHGVPITWDGPVPYCSVLIYNPRRRYEAWRFVTYMLVHIGIAHFVFNMLMQIIVGVSLEMAQEGWMGSVRVAVVYMSGVIAGSLGTSVSDPDTFIAGASGGVYALISAHLATLILNWKEDSAVKIKKVIHKPLTRMVRLIFIVFLTIHDIALAVYVRYYSDGENRTGFMGHACGAMAGLLVGVFILDNRRVRPWEAAIQYISLGLFIMFVLFTVVWNIFADSWFPEGYYPESDKEAYDDASGNCQHYEYF